MTLPAFLASLLGLLVATSALADTTVRFDIDMRAEIAAGRFDAATDRVGLRGGAAPLSWGRSLFAERGHEAGHQVLMLVLPDDAAGGQPLAYKFRIERGAAQDGSDGWEPGRNHALVLTGGEVRVARVFGAPAVDVPLSRVGTIERLGAVPSRHVGARDVQVWLPPGYAADAPVRYPVLYLHDGQNVFDAQAAGAEWQVDEAAQRGVTNGRLRPFIVVAVASTAARVADYTPTAMQAPAGREGGGAPAYARFLVEELKPAIDARYRTRPGAADTAVGGSSLGGLVSMWLALHRGGTFGAALVVSPSVWWDDRVLLRDVAASARPTMPPRVWLDMGGQEGEQAVTQARELAAALRRQGFSSVRFVEDPAGGHDEASWARRVPAMLEFLYGTAEKRP